MLEQIQQMLSLLIINAPQALLFVLLFIGIHCCNALLGLRLNYLGIIPRRPLSVLGIFLHPFLHANFKHLFFNMVPLFALADFFLSYGQRFFLHLTLCLIVMVGTAVWVFGRLAIHIGASALVMAYFGLALTIVIKAPSAATLLIGFLLLYYFGGLFSALIPTLRKESWEGHVLGFLCGISVFYFPNLLFL